MRRFFEETWHVDGTLAEAVAAMVARCEELAPRRPEFEGCRINPFVRAHGLGVVAWEVELRYRADDGGA